MKRNAKQIRRLIRAQTIVADKARLAHGIVQAQLARNGQDLAALDAHAERADAQSLALLDLYVERARALAREREKLTDAAAHTQRALVQRAAAIAPLHRRHRQAVSTEERAEHERQMSELIDRLAAVPQASRKPDQQ